MFTFPWRSHLLLMRLEDVDFYINIMIVIFLEIKQAEKQVDESM